MKYGDGQEVRVGDRVRLGEDDGGVVVCDIGAREFSSAFTESEWVYLDEGIVIEFPQFGVLYMKILEPGLELICRR